MHAGEIGLFVDSEIFESEFATIKSNTDLEVKATQPRSLPQMRHAWALATKISDSGVLGDASQRETMDYLLLKAKHVRYVTNRHRDGIETTAVVKSIRFASMDQTEFQRLYNRMIFIVASEILPEMPEGELRDEVERMAGVGIPQQDPAPVKPRQRRPRASEKVSVIPADDVPGDAGAQPLPPADAPAPPAPPPAAQVKAEPAPLKEPTNVETWKAYGLIWLGQMDDDGAATDVDVLARWSGETKLRNACGVTGEDRQPLFELMNAILEKKREAQAKRT